MAEAPMPGSTKPVPKMRPARFEWDGKTYTYDPSAITVKVAIAIKLHTGLALRAWAQACDAWDPVCVQALMWAVKAQNGETCDINSLDFSVSDFMEAFTPAMLEAIAAVVMELGDEGSEDPTEAEVETPLGTPTSADSEMSTSSSSPTSAI